MNSLATAMLDAGVIQKDDIERVAEEERTTKQQERAVTKAAAETRAQEAEALRIALVDKHFRAEFRKLARVRVRPLVAAAMRKRLGPPKDDIARRLQEDLIDAYTESELDRVEGGIRS